jgi:hypothetical protein
MGVLGIASPKRDCVWPWRRAHKTDAARRRGGGRQHTIAAAADVSQLLFWKSNMMLLFTTEAESQHKPRF